MSQERSAEAALRLFGGSEKVRIKIWGFLQKVVGEWDDPPRMLPKALNAVRFFSIPGGSFSPRFLGALFGEEPKSESV
jgi:hypothetical protein